MAPPTASSPLRFLPGIGPARAAALAAAGLETCEDLLLVVPRCLAAAPEETTAGPLPRGVPVQVRARILRTALRPFGRRRVLDCHFVAADGQALRVRFFNAAWMRDRLPPGEWFLLEGRSDPKQGNTLNHPRCTHLAQGASDGRAARSGCTVSYPALAGLGGDLLARLVATCLDQIGHDSRDPAGLLGPADWHHLLQDLHRPADPERHEAARRELARRECLALAWLLQGRRAQAQAGAALPIPWDDVLHQRALARLPFTLTAGQQAAAAEIRANCRQAVPMYRLLQGEVGSGKTALALLAALAAIAAGRQVLLLAPTALLAEQHRRFIAACLQDSRVVIGLLTGGTSGTERTALLRALGDGRLDLLIGTHALLEDTVRPARCGLVIIDEQHKFGVHQRARLLAGGDSCPHLLLMTATPIPRTLALTAFGDLAISRILGKPPGRAPVTTELLPWQGEVLVAAIRTALAAGGRAFVICALKAPSDQVRAQDAPRLAARLEQDLPGTGIALVHGDLDEQRKHDLLDAFRDGRRPVLVSTIVVEVGIDVPDANLLAVCDSERFGLAQLHQLRGRIGRGHLPGRCLFFHAAEGAAERLAILARSEDGLTIAEADLAQRGPGELLGTRQHGLPELRRADLTRDLDLLQEAHAAVRQQLADGASCPPGLARLLPPDLQPDLLAGG